MTALTLEILENARNRVLNQSGTPQVLVASENFIDRFLQLQKWLKMGQKGKNLILKDTLLRRKEYWKGKKRKVLPLPK